MVQLTQEELGRRSLATRRSRSVATVLSPDRVEAIKERLSTGTLRKIVAIEFGVTPEVVRKIALDSGDKKIRGVAFVYFIQAASGPIKIGVSRDPAARILSLQCALWEEIKILGSTPTDTDGAFELEAALHREFATTRLLGEWFQPSVRLLERIRLLCSVSDNRESA